MYLPLRIVDNEDGPLGRQAEAIALAHSSIKDVLVPRVPEAFRPALTHMPVRVFAAAAGQTTIAGQCETYAGDCRISLYLPNQKPAHEAAFVTEYQGVLAHEVCHGMRTQFSLFNTLGDALVHEGLSLHFGRVLDKTHGTSFADSMRRFNVGQMANLLEQATPYLRDTDYNYDAVFNGSPAGYTLGEQVVGLYMAGSGKPAGQLLATPTEAFFNYAHRHIEQTARHKAFIDRYTR